MNKTDGEKNKCNGPIATFLRANKALVLIENGNNKVKIKRDLFRDFVLQSTRNGYLWNNLFVDKEHLEMLQEAIGDVLKMLEQDAQPITVPEMLREIVAEEHEKVDRVIKTPKHILRILRQRKDLDENDTSRDGELESLTPKEKFYEVLTWELGASLRDKLLVQARDCGIKIDDSN